MEQYHNLLKDILENGEVRSDRTLTGTLSVFGRQLRFNLTHSFPAITTKKLAWRACVAELLWFLEGSSDERRLAEITHGTRDATKTTIWTGNAQSNYWKPKAKFEGDLGKVYGVQWRYWMKRTANPEQEEWYNLPVYSETSIDQVKNLIDGIKNDPMGRRHIISAWNVAELDQMALPPCHVMSQFYVGVDGTLSCHMYQRSADVFLGVPFNIASYALLTHMIAHVTGLKAKELVISFGDTHIYQDHIEQVKEQLSREAYPEPTLWLNPAVTDIDKFTMDDIKLNNYQSHDAIKASMAV
jgi:thymidylate synthase